MQGAAGISRLSLTDSHIMSQGSSENTEQLASLLEAQNESTQKLQAQVEELKLRNQLEARKMEQEQWEMALLQLKEAREATAKEHAKNMETMKEMKKKALSQSKSQAVAWLDKQLHTDQGGNPTPKSNTIPEEDTTHQVKQHLLNELKAQQAELQKKIEDISSSAAGEDLTTLLKQALPTTHTTARPDQQLLMEQIKAALGPKTQDKDTNKTLLKALLTTQNRTSGLQGTSTLKPDILNRLSSEEFSIPGWLASLNK